MRYLSRQLKLGRITERSLVKLYISSAQVSDMIILSDLEGIQTLLHLSLATKMSHINENSPDK